MPKVDDAELTQLAFDLVTQLRQRGQLISFAESCTGGLLAETLTRISGSSACFERSYVCYSNQAKIEELEVSHQALEHGAVSQEVVKEMALGACRRANSDYAIAVSGIAGPDGGNANKPVGTVWIAWATPTTITSEVFHFSGNRIDIRAQTAQTALTKLLSLLPLA